MASCSVKTTALGDEVSAACEFSRKICDSLANDDIFRCPVCCMKYNEGPRVAKMLPCHHTFCLSCLKTIREETRQLNCPLCREPVDCGIDLESLKSNFYLKQFQEALQSSNQEDDVDESGEACIPQEGVCSLHKNAPRRKWCVTCDQPICGICHRTNHTKQSGHNVKPIAHFKREAIAEVLDLVTSVEEKVSELQSKFESLKKRFSPSYDRIIQKLLALSKQEKSKEYEDIVTLISKQSSLCASMTEGLRSVGVNIPDNTVNEIILAKKRILTQFQSLVLEMNSELVNLEQKLVGRSTKKVALCIKDDNSQEGASGLENTLHCAFCGRECTMQSSFSSVVIGSVVIYLNNDNDQHNDETETQETSTKMCRYCNALVIEP